MNKYYLESNLRNAYGTVIFYYSGGDWIMELGCCVGKNTKCVVDKNTVVDVLSSGILGEKEERENALNALRYNVRYNGDVPCGTEVNFEKFGEDVLKLKGVDSPNGYAVDFDSFSDKVYTELEVYNEYCPEEVLTTCKYPLGDVEYLVNTLEII